RAASRTASIDSSFAGPMNAHVLTTRTSAPSGSRTSSWPARASTPSMISESTWFFGQPSVSRCTREPTAPSVAEVDELHRDGEVLPAQPLHHGLQVVALLPRDADLVALDRRLHLELRVLHQLHDLARLVDRDALLQVDRLLRGPRGSGLGVLEGHALERHLPLRE